MSKQKLAGRHVQVKSGTNVARVTAAAAVTGGLVAGLSAAGSAGASTSTPSHEAFVAATTPLELKSITPAKALVIRAQAAGASNRSAHVAVSHKRVSRSTVRAALTTPATPKTVQVQAASAKKAVTTQAGPARHHQRHHVKRAHVRRAMTTFSAPASHRFAKPAATATAVPHVKHTKRHTFTQELPSTQAEMPNAGSILSIAASHLGIPYVWGGSSTSGIDCSGFVSMVYKQATGVALPHQSGQIAAMVTPTNNPQPGDLVLYRGHVAIYAGNGMVYEARQGSDWKTGYYKMMPGGWFGHINH